MNKIFLTIIALLSVQVLAHAEWVKGNIVELDVKNNTVTIQRTDDRNNKDLPDRLQVRVKRDADFKNFTSLNDLHMGNHVNVNIRENKDLGLWEGSSVELYNAERDRK